MPPQAECWNQSGPVNVVTYTNCDSVSLYVNSTKIGTEYLDSFPINMIIQWTNVPYQSGVIKAIGMKDGVAAAFDSIKTAGPPAKIILKPDRTTMYADGNDVSCIEVDIADSNNTFVYNAVDTVHFSMTGAGRSLGIASGDWTSNEPFKATSRSVYHGKVLIVIQSTMVPGTINVTVSAPGLAPSSLTLTTVPQPITTSIRSAPLRNVLESRVDLFTCKYNPGSKNIEVRYRVDIPGAITLSVFSASGRIVNCLTNNKYRTAGTYSTEWNARVRSGVYLFALKMNNRQMTRKVVIAQ
jgi:hypothetical protein